MKGKFFLLGLSFPPLFLLLFKLLSGLERLGPLKIRGIENPAVALLALLNLALLLKFSLPGRKDLLALSFIVLSFLTLFHPRWMAPYRVEGDGVGYFSYLRSMVYDGDLDFENEFTRLQASKFGIGSLEGGRYRRLRKTGLVSNPFSVGPALLWSLLYLPAKFITGAKTGYEPPLLYSVALAHWIMGFLGTLLLFFTLRKAMSPLYSLLALEGILLASPLFYYLRHEPFLSHIPSFFTLSLFIFLLSRVGTESPGLYWFLLGGSVGLASLVRWQNGIFVLLPAAVLVYLLLKKEITPGKFLSSAALLGTGLFLALLPQALVFKKVYGAFLTVPQGNKFLSILPIYLPHSLFSPFHGLFQWHPLLLGGLLGFFLRWGEGEKLRNLGLGGFSAAAVANGLVRQFWAGASFGARRYIGSLGFLSFGLGNFFHRIGKRASLYLLGAFFFLNTLMEIAYNREYIPHEVPWGMEKIIYSLLTHGGHLLSPKLWLLYSLYFLLLVLLSRKLAKEGVNL